MLRPRRIRLSIRILLFVTFLVAIVLAWFSVTFTRYRRESAIFGQIAATGGKAYTVPRKPEWLWQQFGDDVAQRGTSLLLADTDVTDSQIAQLGTLHDLGGLYLERTSVTNEGLVCLAGMRGLVALSLRRTKVTELPSLSHMEQLKDLDISFTTVSHVDLTGLDALESLRLRATRLDDNALEHFPPLPELKSLDIAGAPGCPMSISDRGIAHITSDRFPKLNRIYLYRCDVSDVQIDRLQSEFPGIRLHLSH